MSPLRNIFVGVDGSVYSHVAIELAIQWAKRNACRLLGIDVVDEDSIKDEYYGLVEKAAEYRQENLQQERSRADHSLDTFEVRRRECGIDAARSREAGDPSELIQGSTTKKPVRESPVPVFMFH